jgi:hypothetical protein
MSFFLAEVSLLKFEKKELLENIAKLILNTGFEEEKDGETSGDNLTKEINLFLQHLHIHGNSSIYISVKLNRILVDHYRHADHSLVFSPPPDLMRFS